MEPPGGTYRFNDRTGTKFRLRRNNGVVGIISEIGERDSYTHRSVEDMLKWTKTFPNRGTIPFIYADTFNYSTVMITLEM
jgi:hypothetical protein